MTRQLTEDSGLLHSFDEARKMLKHFAMRMRSWGTFHDNRLIHDGFNQMVRSLHIEQDDIDDRNSMLRAFAERVALVTKGMTDPEQIRRWKHTTLEHYDVTIEELDAFASKTGTLGYPELTRTA